MQALNASGRAPAAATLDEFKKRGLQRIPLRGELSVSVPGVVDGWHELLVEARHAHAGAGARAGDRIRARRIRRQRNHRGPVEERRRRCWRAIRRRPRRSCPAATRRRPATSSRNPKLAASLELIAKGGRDAFYKGPIAKAIADDMQRRKGLLTASDLADHTSDWVEPISTTYRGYEVLELPPNTQGIARSRCSTSSKAST